MQMPGGPSQGVASGAEAEGLAGAESAGPRSLDMIWGNGKPLEQQRQRSVRFKRFFCKLPWRQLPPLEELGEGRAW